MEFLVQLQSDEKRNNGGLLNKKRFRKTKMLFGNLLDVI